MERFFLKKEKVRTVQELGLRQADILNLEKHLNKLQSVALASAQPASRASAAARHALLFCCASLSDADSDAFSSTDSTRHDASDAARPELLPLCVDSRSSSTLAWHRATTRSPCSDDAFDRLTASSLRRVAAVALASAQPASRASAAARHALLFCCASVRLALQACRAASPLPPLQPAAAASCAIAQCSCQMCNVRPEFSCDCSEIVNGCIQYDCACLGHRKGSPKRHRCVVGRVPCILQRASLCCPGRGSIGDDCITLLSCDGKARDIGLQRSDGGDVRGVQSRKRGIGVDQLTGQRCSRRVDCGSGDRGDVQIDPQSSSRGRAGGKLRGKIILVRCVAGGHIEAAPEQL